MMRVPQMFWKVWRSGHQQPATIAAVQHRRLLRLVQFARHHSFWYQQHYRQVPEDFQDVQLLPPVTKADLMAYFDEWVTDRAVTKTRAEAFVADKTRIGGRYLDRYAVWSTSGVTGHPGYFVQDPDALAVYTALMTVRGYRWLIPGRLSALVKGGRALCHRGCCRWAFHLD